VALYDDLHAYLRATPWAIPCATTASVAIVGWSRQLSALTGWPRRLAIPYGVALAGFLSVTTTPSSWTLVAAGASRRTASWSFQPVRPSDLLRISEQSLNVWLAVPLGAMAAVVALSHGSVVAPAVAVAAPPFAEAFQWLFPQLGRSAFLLQDVGDNWEGLVIGLGVASAVFAKLHLKRK
jgi:hypothetical protein